MKNIFEFGNIQKIKLMMVNLMTSGKKHVTSGKTFHTFFKRLYCFIVIPSSLLLSSLFLYMWGE